VKVNNCSYPEDQSVIEEFKKYINQPYVFIDFIDLPILKDGDISLVCIKKSPANPSRNWVPSYQFSICLNEKSIGQIDLRIGYNEGLYYGGNIGYSIDEEYRGHSYTVRACRLLMMVAKAHQMKSLNISNEYSNHASFRVCEKLGAKFSRVVKLPEWNEMRSDDHEYENIFIWEIE
jgi:RimJ/RimL family protein N-acetyltransferase